jgi:hypothetical protein
MEKKALNKREKQIGAVLLIITAFVIMAILPEDKTPEPTNKQAVEVVPFYTIPNPDWIHTPENYVINFYRSINDKNWNKLSTISNGEFYEDPERVASQFQTMNIKGLKIIDTKKESKALAYVKAHITYTKSTEEIQTKEVDIRLELLDDFQTWIISPYTTF